MSLSRTTMTLVTLMGLFAWGAEAAPKSEGNPVSANSEIASSPIARVEADAIEPKVVSGSLTIRKLKSEVIGNRGVYLWVPAGFDSSAAYDVLFMHDGQMLFDASTTWNGQAWDVDDVVTELQRRGQIGQLVVVGVDNAGEHRRAEYFPEGAADWFPETKADLAPSWFYSLRADKYVGFLVAELRDWLQTEHGLLATPENSYLMGSSMGGLISMYVLTRYPDAFAGAACLSTHWPGDVPVDSDSPLAESIQSYLQQTLPAPGHLRWYFDYGTATLDQYYEPWQQRADAVMATRGYRQGIDWVTRKFEGAEHSEKAWKARLAIPLMFLFDPKGVRRGE